MSDSQPQSQSRPQLTSLGPYSIEAEEAVLGSILINPEVLANIAEFLRGDDFFEQKHIWIWEAMVSLATQGEEVDNLTVTDELRRQKRLEDAGGSAYITYLINNTPTHIHAETYARLVEVASVRRRLLGAAGQIAQIAREETVEIQEVISKVESVLFGVTDQRAKKDLVAMEQAVKEYYDRIQTLFENPNEQLGVTTGFRDLDNLLGGWQRSDLCIVAARPGVGKTSFLLGVALNAARMANAKVAIFSLEMGREQLVQRLYAVETGINSQQLRLGRLTNEEWERFVEATSKLVQLPITIDDTPGISIQQLRARCRRLSREQGLDLVIVDYLQLLSSGVVSRQDNRQQEISLISRNLKEMARELKVPVISAAQLSRAVEQRADKRPQLSDLRESGCLTGDTMIYLPESGRYVPIADLNNHAGFKVTSLNTDTWTLSGHTVSHAFYSGYRPVFRLTTQLGRSIRATANHKFLTFNGWKRLDELTTDDLIALPRVLRREIAPSQSMSNSELAFLGHMLGDGCALPSHALQYTTREPDLAEHVVELASAAFPGAIAPRISQERGWYQVYMPSTQHLTHNVRNPVNAWLENLGIYGLRSFEKRLPDAIFTQPDDAIALFLRHLWATDGCIAIKTTENKRPYPAVYYATSSIQLARGVQSLLLRLGINARIKRVPQVGKGRDQYHVGLSGNEDLTCFVNTIGAVGSRRTQILAMIAEYVGTHASNTNRDIIPRTIWRRYAVPAMQVKGMTARQMQAQLGNAYCGTGLYKQNVSRARAAKLASIVGSDDLARLAVSDVYWDQIESIEADGEADVYDLTVPGPSNFVANDIVVHNSIEQDSDIVTFLYRDELYNPNTERPNQAEVIIAKHRNGPTGIVTLYFKRELTQFVDMVKSNVNLSTWS